MQAARIHGYGAPAAIMLEEIDAPIPNAGEVLLKVKAAGVGNWDALIRSGRSGLTLSLPLTLGAEVAGTIATVAGATSLQLKAEDAVYGSTNALFIGAYAEYAVCSTDMVARKPESHSWAEAASLPVAAVTAWQMVVEHAQVTSGQTVVVHGAAGNVGALAVQIARTREAHVIGTIHNAGDEALMRTLGVTDVLRNEGDSSGLSGAADAVIDTVGGPSQASLVSLLKPGGILVSSVSKPDAGLIARQRARGAYFIVRVTAAALSEIAKLLQAGRLKTRVGGVMPLADARIAHEMLDGTRPRPGGKIVLSLE